MSGRERVAILSTGDSHSCIQQLAHSAAGPTFARRAVLLVRLFGIRWRCVLLGRCILSLPSLWIAIVFTVVANGRRGKTSR